MPEAIPDTIPKVESIEEFIGHLQANMRLYDELTAQLTPLLEEQEGLNIELKQYDLEKALEKQLTIVAFAALNKVIIDKKVDEIEKQVGKTTSAYLLSSILYEGRKVAVRALNPDKQKIHQFFHPDGTYSGRQKTEAEGRILHLGLHPNEGGFITVLSKRGFARYQSSPLFDRENDYQPLFEVTSLELLGC
jgi:hypothetical protein